MVQLIEKTHDQIAEWLPGMQSDYIEQRVGSGEPRAVAESGAAAQMAQLFPDGVPADGQHVMNVVVDDEAVGTLWMGRPFNAADDTWFVFYVEIDEACRGQGHGRVAMQAAEAWTREHGGSKIALNVFGPNTVARSLYDSLGYHVMATAMFKDL